MKPYVFHDASQHVAVASMRSTQWAWCVVSHWHSLNTVGVMCWGARAEITDVVRETEETSGSEGTFAPKSATSALGSCVELPEYSHPEFRAEVWPQSTCGETRGTTWTEHLTRCHMIRVQYHNHLMLGLTMIEFGLYCKDFHCLLKLPMAGMWVRGVA